MKKKVAKEILKIKIGALTYKIEFVHPHELQDDYGEFDAETLSIKINENLPKDLQKTTIIHEIIEAINYQYEFKFKHNVITLLESILYQVLKENKKFFDQLLK